jgi:hypothetical protein
LQKILTDDVLQKSRQFAVTAGGFGTRFVVLRWFVEPMPFTDDFAPPGMCHAATGLLPPDTSSSPRFTFPEAGIFGRCALAAPRFICGCEQAGQRHNDNEPTLLPEKI